MSRPDEDHDKRPDWQSDRTLWRRSQAIDAPEDEAARLLDLAGFADGLLDPDEGDRVAALLAADPAAAADVAAARAPAGNLGEPPAGLEGVIDRACAILPDRATPRGRVVAFAPSPQRRRMLRDVAQWGSLAAAMAVASWLGFAMGSDASSALGEPTASSEAGLLPELLDPGGGFLRDFGEGQRT